jgi:hypothetical protein
MVQQPLRLRPPRLPLRAWLLDDLALVVLWNAAVMQRPVVIDPRYRDFPFPAFVVSELAISPYILLGDLPVNATGRS